MATANGTPTTSWGLVQNASVAMKGSVSCQYTNIEIAITNTASAPSASIEGHFVAARHTEPVELQAGSRLWWRIAPMNAGTPDAAPTGVYTLTNT